MVSIQVENYCYKCSEDIKLVSKEDRGPDIPVIIFSYKCNKCGQEQQLELYYGVG